MTANAGKNVEQVNTPPLLVGVQICTVTLEINKDDSQKTGTRSTSQPSYGTLEHVPKGYDSTGHLLNYGHSYFISNCQTVEII